MTNLWNSVFTPGTTPTLLVATNASFAALQVLLLALLAATQSIHFVILSILCGGLWYSINWFAVEVQIAKAQEAEAESNKKRDGKKKKDWRKDGEVEDSADDEGEDTEVDEVRGLRTDVSKDEGTAGRARTQLVDAKSSGIEALERQASVGAGLSARQARGDDGDRSGEISTDSEWEKVSQDGDR